MSDGNHGNLVARLKAGDEQAWCQLVDQYSKRLLQWIRKGLPRWIQARVDIEDLLQEVFLKLADQVRTGKFECDSDDRLGDILRSRATERIMDEVRKHLAGRRDVRRERPRSSLPLDCEHGEAEPNDPHFGPDHAADIHDEFVQFVNSLDLCEQVVVQLRLEHGTLEKVADALQWSLRKVQGIWEGICKKAREGKEGRKEKTALTAKL